MELFGEKNKFPESISDIIRTCPDYFQILFSSGKQRKKLTIIMHENRSAAGCYRADMSSDSCGARHATNIGVG